MYKSLIGIIVIFVTIIGCKSQQEKIDEAIAKIDAKALFKNNCAICHGGNAEGKIGPNLTDNYWVYGASEKEIEKNINIGFPDKGMPMFSQNMDSIKVKALARYIFATLRGKMIEGKGFDGYEYKQEGDKYIKIGNTLVQSSIKVPDSIPIISSDGNVATGKELFNVVHGCAHCHGTNAYGHIDNRDIKQSSSRYGDNWLRVVDMVLHNGRSGTAMPAWNMLSKKELADIKAFVISVQNK